jgi:putative PIN family toxin of toxin-antitoxin system
LHKINRTPERILTELRLIAEFVDAPALLAPVCRDPDDDKVLAAAVAARADWVVSGDLDLLSLGAFQGIRILTPAAAVDWISAR